MQCLFTADPKESCHRRETVQQVSGPSTAGGGHANRSPSFSFRVMAFILEPSLSGHKDDPCMPGWPSPHLLYHPSRENISFLRTPSEIPQNSLFICPAGATHPSGQQTWKTLLYGVWIVSLTSEPREQEQAPKLCALSGNGALLLPEEKRMQVGGRVGLKLKAKLKEMFTLMDILIAKWSNLVESSACPLDMLLLCQPLSLDFSLRTFSWHHTTIKEV